MSEENESLIHRYFDEILSRNNLAAAGELIAPDVIFHPLEIHGLENFMQYVSVLHNAFPDLNFVVEDEVNNADKSAVRFTMRGTHKGEFRGISASNNQVEISGIDFFRIADNRIKEIWVSLDTLSFMQQLGAATSPENS